MEAPTIAALVVSVLYFIAATVDSQVNADPQSAIAIFLGLIMLLVLPYLVHCLVVGGCTWYAWAVPGLMGLMLLVGLFTALFGSRARPSAVQGDENKNLRVRKE